MPLKATIGIVIDEPDYTDSIDEALDALFGDAWWYESGYKHCVTIVVEGGSVTEVNGLEPDQKLVIIDKDIGGDSRWKIVPDRRKDG